MAIDFFMKLDGVDGECIVKGMEKTTQILAWSWGMSQTGTTHHGTGGGAGKVNVQDLSFTKNVDKSTPVVMQACCTGKHFDKATLTCRKAGGDSPLVYLTIEMTNVIVTSVSSGGSGGEDQQTENITLNFAAFTVAYQGQNEKGAKQDGQIKINYHIAKNEV